jgi:hypothetical protein
MSAPTLAPLNHALEELFQLCVFVLAAVLLLRGMLAVH